jgi:hypothetical protein
MTFAEFKRQLNEDVKEVLEAMEEGEDNYLETLPPDPTLEDYYAMFFTAWNDNVREIVFET